MSTTTEDPIRSEEALMDMMSEPTPEVEEAVQAIEGDILILGIAGKMGPSLGRLLVRAGAKSIIGVSRFSNPEDAGDDPDDFEREIALLDAEIVKQVLVRTRYPAIP